MRFGLSVINMWSVDLLLELAFVADDAGWEGFFLWDHVAFSNDLLFQDPWVLLGAIAARTDELRLGTLVTPLARRRPQIVAREAVTLDRISKGRAVLGVGLGGVEGEFSAFGEESDARVRAEKLDEALEVVTKLWSGEVVEHHGKYYRVDGVAFLPRPVQEPRIPIWVGGHSKAAQRRASRYDGWAPGGPAPSVGEKGVSLERLRENVEYIRRNRREKNPIEVVYSIEMPEKSEELGELIRRSQLAGVTWLLESVHGIKYSHEQAIERVMAGPPQN